MALLGLSLLPAACRRRGAAAGGAGRRGGGVVLRHHHDGCGGRRAAGSSTQAPRRLNTRCLLPGACPVRPGWWLVPAIHSPSSQPSSSTSRPLVANYH